MSGTGQPPIIQRIDDLIDDLNKALTIAREARVLVRVFTHTLLPGSAGDAIITTVHRMALVARDQPPPTPEAGDALAEPTGERKGANSDDSHVIRAAGAAADPSP